MTDSVWRPRHCQSLEHQETGEMVIDMDSNHDERLKKFLEEGTEWFKTQHLPVGFPGLIAQVSEAVGRLNENILQQAESNNKLSQSVVRATWVLVIIGFLGSLVEVIK